jgi:CheY-like chemotaxis protein
MGISPDDLSKIFTPFERIGAEKTKTEGTGLGLAVVKKLMDAMGGKIGVESAAGEGSTFWIELPQGQNQLEVIQRTGAFLSADSNNAINSGTILYVEDNESNIELVRQILSTQRPNIQLVSNLTGKGTVESAINCIADLILLDLDLPEMHGSEAFELIKKDINTRHIPVVIISADAMPKQIEKLLKAGAKRYLTKPLDIAEFLEVVDEWISASKN